MTKNYHDPAATYFRVLCSFSTFVTDDNATDVVAFRRFPPQKGASFESESDNPAPVCVFSRSSCKSPLKNITFVQKRTRMHTFKLSLKLEAWYWAYLAIVVCERWEMQAHTFLPVWGSQFSSEGCWICVRTSTLWSGLASTKVFVENKPKSSLRAEAKPRITAIGCFRQNSWSWGLNACFLLSK